MGRITYEEAIKYMAAAQSRGSILGHERIIKLCEALGNPQDELKYIHVAGTNGKGSTSCFIASVLKEAGYKVGFYYSPALRGIDDHYMINGQAISQDDYTLMVERLIEANDVVKCKLHEEATSFELETALAFLYFVKYKCDFVVLETGLGGRDDATNIVGNKLLAVITSVSYDHMAILGNSLSEIATVKAGIIIEGCETVAIDSGKEVTEALKTRCKEVNSQITLVNNSDYEYDNNKGNLTVSYGNYKNVLLSLEGTYQCENGALALAAISRLIALGYNISDESVYSGMRNTYWPYRFECISNEPLIYIDGAHNADAAGKLSKTIREGFLDKRIIMVIGMFADKECDKVIEQMAPMATCIVTLTTPNNIRALDAVEIKKLALKNCDDVTSCNTVGEAARLAIRKCLDIEDNKGMVLAFGSLSYLDEFKRAVANEQN